MILTPNQIHELLDIIDKNSLIFVSHNVGVSVLSEQERALLKIYGVDINSIPSSSSKVYEAYKFGILSNALDKLTLDKMNYKELKRTIEKAPRLNSLQMQALENLKLQTYADVMNLNSKIKTEVTDIFVKADKKRNTVQHSKLVTDAAKKAIQNNKWTQEIVSELGQKTKLWERDLGRISDFVLHTAFDEGRVSKIQEKKGDEALVYKDVYAGACKHCQSLYLTGGIGSPPRIFSIKLLKGNATNVGRKVNEWKPVVGPTHPFCRCTIEECPEGFTIADMLKGIWEWNGKLWVRNWDKTKEHEPAKVKRKSKVKVKVNNKNYEI